jgi:hypothetical protein
VILFAHTNAVTKDERAGLEARGIAVVDGVIERLVVTDDRLRAIQLADGRSVPRDALFMRPQLRPHADGLAAALGCKLQPGGLVATDADGRTSVPGVWAAGNAANPRAQVITAAGRICGGDRDQHRTRRRRPRPRCRASRRCGVTNQRQPGALISVVDPEMRHGRKSQSQRFDGFKLSAAVTNTPQPLITAVDVAPATAQDGPQAKHLIDVQPPERRPRRVLGDTAYGIGPVRAELAERDVDVLAPLAPGSAKPGRFGKRDFRIDPSVGIVICPAGETATIRTDPSGARRARFAKPTCDSCALRDRCVEPVKAAKTVLLAPQEELLIAARQALEDPLTAEHLRRTRPRVERLLGLLAHRYKARKSRYIGTRKARLQAAWTAALVNLNPIGRHLAAQPT